MEEEIIKMAKSGKYSLRGIARELNSNLSMVRNVCLKNLTEEEYQGVVKKKYQKKQSVKEIVILLDKNGKLVSVKGAPYQIFQECAKEDTYETA